MVKVIVVKVIVVQCGPTKRVNCTINWLMIRMKSGIFGKDNTVNYLQFVVLQRE